LNCWQAEQSENPEYQKRKNKVKTPNDKKAPTSKVRVFTDVFSDVLELWQPPWRLGQL
jgi:hypothetical protein